LLSIKGPTLSKVGVSKLFCKSFSEKSVKIQNWRKKFIIVPFYESSLKQLLDEKDYDLE